MFRKQLMDGRHNLDQKPVSAIVSETEISARANGH